MALDADDTLKDADLHGFKYLKKLLPLFESLRGAGCERDTAGNRILHDDQYCCLILLQLFSPAVATLRLIQKASGMEKVQRILGCARTMAYWYMTGLASEKEFNAHLNQPDNRSVKLRAKDQLWKKLGC